MPAIKPVRVEKPWGYELIWAHTDRYVGKILHIDKGQALSLQYHLRKDETIHVLAGVMRFETGGGGAEREKTGPLPRPPVHNQPPPRPPPNPRARAAVPTAPPPPR